MNTDTKDEELVTSDIAEAMGVSLPAFEQVQCIIGRMPTVQELSTLLAMWDANGRQQSLYGWLKGQHHTVERNDYLYTGTDEQHKVLREPRVKDCIALAHGLLDSCKGMENPSTDVSATSASICRGDLLYMVGNVGTDFLDSEYGRRCLHVAQCPVKMESDQEDIEYLELILGSLLEAGAIRTFLPVGKGGLFTTLVFACRRCSQGTVGFDLLTCREVRLDAFLFGEEGGRYLVALPEKQDDFFLLKMQEAGVNCCFLGHATKGRVLVDDMDYGPISAFGR